LPVSFLFLREADQVTPPAMVGVPGPVGADVKPMAAFGSRAFWTLMAASTLVCASASGVASHFVPWGAELGISGGTATFALTLYSLAGPFSSLIAGATADRLPRPGLLAIVFAVPLLGFLAMQTSHEWAVVVGFALLGAGFAAVAGLLPFLTSRYFGLANASTIFGVAVGLSTLSLGAGPVVLGLLRDEWGTYASGTPVVVGALLLAVLLAATLPRYPNR
jgi:predicted MFS family arabinose efflux permease